MTRDPGKLGDRPWAAEVEIAGADALDLEAVAAALDGVDVAYYLIHSLGSVAGFEERDVAAATIFAEAAAAAGSFISEASSRPRTANCRRTSVPGTRSVTSCWLARCRRRCCRRQ
jgi:uncharacterized protein YbjT (DUF2867 family)